MSSPNDHGQDIKAPKMRSVLGDAPTERLSMPFDVRVTGATALGMLTGFTLGLTNAGSMAGLRFRAEHAHIFPTENAGWYLYHRSKNYHVILGGLKGGVKLGSKIGFWAGSFFLVEEAVDRYWQSKNFISSTVAGGTVAGAFSALHRMSAPAASRIARQGFKGGLLFGLAQDLIGLARGRTPRYIEYFLGKRQRANPTMALN